MNSLVVVFSLLIFLKADDADKELPIVPKPVYVQMNEGVFTFNKNVVMYVPKFDPKAHYPAQHLCELFEKSCGYSFKISEYETVPAPLPSSAVIFIFSETVKEDEGYELRIHPERIVVYAKDTVGMFHAAITIRQLLPPSIEIENGTIGVTLSLDCCVVKDYPQYPYRGFMLDTGRHFSTIQDVKQFIDLLALHKMSVFHFHLTEDQGWRIEIKKYPKLIEIGAWRNKTESANFVSLSSNDPEFGMIDNENLDDEDSSSLQKSNDPPGKYGGYYSQDQIRDIVHYAESRGITVIPEIELPGHAVAAIASYPNLSCSGKQVEIPTTWGIFTPVFCSKEETMLFLQDVLSEVMGLFPDAPYVHIGGDECPTTDWQECERCHARMREQNITSYSQLESYFIQRMEKHVNKQGKRIIGWDEIYDGGKIGTNTIIMIWHSADIGRKMLETGFDIILTPTSHCYLDYEETNLSLVYDFDPFQLVYNSSMKNDTRPNRSTILGGQGNLWTERLPTQEKRCYNTFPRLAALAEAMWTNRENKDYSSFLYRMNNNIVPRYKALNVTYNPTHLNEL